MITLVKELFKPKTREMPEKRQYSTSADYLTDRVLGYKKCEGDHTVFQTTRISRVYDILDKGFKTTAKSASGQSAITGIPMTFFSGIPERTYGGIVLVTHTAAFSEPFYFIPPFLDSVRRDIAIARTPRLRRMK